MPTNKKIKNNSRDKGKTIQRLKISKSKKQEARYMNWLFTSYDKKLDDRIEKIAENFEYLRMQLEKSEKNGRLYYQGLLMNKNAISMTSLKKIFNDNTIQFEIVNNLRDAYHYCKKQYTKVGKEFEFGDKALKTIQKEMFDDYLIKNFKKCVIPETIYTMIKNNKISIEEADRDHKSVMKQVRRMYGNNILNIDTQRPDKYHFTGNPGTGKPLFTGIINRVLLNIVMHNNFYFDRINHNSPKIDEFKSNKYNTNQLNQLIDNIDVMKNEKQRIRRGLSDFLKLSTNEEIVDIYKDKDDLMKISFFRQIEIIIEFIKKDDNFSEIDVKIFNFNKDDQIKPIKTVTYSYCSRSDIIVKELYKVAYIFLNDVLNSYLQSDNETKSKNEFYKKHTT
ncbi:hypothetical protein DMUE_2962 [Dictyocoela muelleri]|nr:hypothetical protein DMUE_2962 [Dictyocoela muelleri]